MRLLAAVLAVAATSSLVPAAAVASTTYMLTGYEVNPDPATFVGSLSGQVGIWQAAVRHDPLDYTGTTAITGGSFTITTFRASKQPAPSTAAARSSQAR
jgi:hypothetical protein